MHLRHSYSSAAGFADLPPRDGDKKQTAAGPETARSKMSRVRPVNQVDYTQLCRCKDKLSGMLRLVVHGKRKDENS